MSINDYQIEKQIGSGSFGKVYKGLEIKNNRSVAIKIMKFEKNNQLIKKQIEILNKQKYENIITLYSSFSHLDTHYLIFQYCPYGDLQKYYNHKKKTSQKIAKLIASQLLDALNQLSQQNIAHRDIKLANILINQYYQIKLADLGFAKIQNQTKLLTTYAGTPLMMAPQIFQRKKYTIKCDVWSFGVIIYMLICGKPPFYANTSLNQFIKTIKTKKIQFPKQLDLSLQCKQFLCKCIQKDEDKRWSVKQLLDHEWISEIRKKDYRGQLSKYLKGQYQFERQKQRLQRMHIEVMMEISESLKSVFKIWGQIIMTDIQNIRKLLSNIENGGLRKVIYNVISNRIRQLQYSQIELIIEQVNIRQKIKYDEYFRDIKNMVKEIKSNIKNMDKQLVINDILIQILGIMRQSNGNQDILQSLVCVLGLLNKKFNKFEIKLKIVQNIPQIYKQQIIKKIKSLKYPQIYRIYKYSKKQQNQYYPFIHIFQPIIQPIQIHKNISYIIQFINYLKRFPKKSSIIQIQSLLQQ